MQSFELLKTYVISPPTLTVFDNDADNETVTHLQASTGSEVPCYKSKEAAAGNRRHTQSNHSFELGMLTVHENVKKIRNYLYGRYFVIVTDCNAMKLSWSKK